MNQRSCEEGWAGAGLRHLPWNEIVAVGVRTTAEGPLAEDVFWQILLPGGVVELPGSMVVDLGVLSERLPGFDARKVIAAMGCCTERVFRVWHREESRDRPDEGQLRARFGRLVRRLGAPAPADDAFGRLYAAWSGAARRYHDVEHLADCLREVDGAPSSPSRDLVELALFYHDAIYEPGAPDSEARSAAYLVADAAALGIDGERAAAAAALVEATALDARAATSDDAALVVDIDRAILGRDPLRFLEFEYGVEEEYAALPKTVFLLGRGRVLARLLEAPIYRTAPLRERFEAAARANIGALLRSPRYRPYRWLRWLPAI